jgi:uncharacterized protein (TIGR04255 family)
LTVHKHYKSAPITEAIIDIRVELATGSDASSLEPVQAQVSGQYPTREDLMMVEQQLSFKPDSGTDAKRTKLGYLYRSADTKNVFQTRINGFTFSRFSPYENWESLRSRARQIWDIYKETAKPTRTTRVAVRYINRIDMPTPMKDLREYLRTLPDISPDLSQVLNGYVMQLVMAQKDFGGMLSLIEATVNPPGPNVFSVNLDIDLFKETSEFDSDEKIWQFLEILREKKNEVFEGCITDKAREMFGLIEE